MKRQRPQPGGAGKFNVTDYEVPVNDNNMDDQALMARVAMDDEAAFETLVLRWQQPALRYCQRLLENSAAVQDIVQDCFADIYVQRKKYQPLFSFQAYLFGLIRHKAMDDLRKNARIMAVEDEVLTQWQNAKAGSHSGSSSRVLSPEEQFILREDREWLYSCMRNLKEDYKKELYMYSVREMSYGQIAAATGKTLAQIKIDIYRARRALKRGAQKSFGRGNKAKIGRSSPSSGLGDRGDDPTGLRSRTGKGRRETARPGGDDFGKKK